MQNLIDVTYQQTGKSLEIDQFGMREMQRRAYEKRNKQYLLLKSPPASGKSRALMFLALDKLLNQNISKIIVAVPERSIGKSFEKTKLKENGFFIDWEYDEKFNLCKPGGDKGKVSIFKEFLSSSEKILICTHATLRFAFNDVEIKNFDNCLIAIDEFHHVNAYEGKLGQVVNTLMNKSNSHIIAMTGSYFRGDSMPILLKADEDKFTKINYNYYEQLNGYKYLKSLGIGYHFYKGKYLSAINEVLDISKKTIIHIPNVNAGESTKDKIYEIDAIIDCIGSVEKIDEDTGIIFVREKNTQKILKIADLVNDNPKDREKVINYLRQIEKSEDIDIIIALGMAKEGFDWPFCEHALTIGYRSSLTEIIQIIGRTTRDSDNKIHSQFTNLIAQPDAQDDDVKLSVNNMLKAITASLLMEQVLAPHVNFKSKQGDNPDKPGTIKIGGFKEPSEKIQNIIDSDLEDLKAKVLQDDSFLKTAPSDIDPEIINKVIIPKIIRENYQDLSNEEVEELRHHFIADSVIKSGEVKEINGKKFVRMADQFINIEELHINLIDKINPFQKAFEVISKKINPNLLKIIGETIEAQKIEMSEEEAVYLYNNQIKEFVKNLNRLPDINSENSNEKRMAEAIIFLKDLKRKNNL